MNVFILFVITIGICGFVYFYIQRKLRMRVFTQMNIPGPAPNFLCGNLLSFIKMPIFKTYMDWSEKYGKTFGYFEGPKPVLVTSNLDILRDVYLTNFDCFERRKKFPVQVDPDEGESIHMFFAHGERWRRLRAIISPAFTPAKLKQLEPYMNERIADLENILEFIETKGQEFDIYKLLQCLTLDTILNCGFSLQSDAIKNPEDLYVLKCRKILRDTTRWSFVFFLGFIFPSLNYMWYLLYYLLGHLSGNPVMWMEAQIENIISARKRNMSGPHDLLKHMLDAECQTVQEARRRSSKIGLPSLPVVAVAQDLSDSSSEDDITVENVIYNAPNKKLKVLSQKEVAAQCFVFLLAGFETTSTALAYVIYELATHTEAQTRLQKEIDAYWTEGPPSFENLEYLDMVWKESLRLHPSASTVIARECSQSCTVCGIEIPTGMVVQANVWDVHYSTDIWGTDSHEFNPDRFCKKNSRSRNSLSWMPFGLGYRNCIGARFAVMEGKTTLMRLLKKYTFSICDKTQVPLEVIEGATITPKNGIILKIHKR